MTEKHISQLSETQSTKMVNSTEIG